jgi:hypothetical protein
MKITNVLHFFHFCTPLVQDVIQIGIKCRKLGQIFILDLIKSIALYWTDFHENYYLLNSSTCRYRPVFVQFGRILQQMLANFKLCRSEKDVSHYIDFHEIHEYVTALNGYFSSEFHPNLSKHMEVTDSTVEIHSEIKSTRTCTVEDTIA